MGLLWENRRVNHRVGFQGVQYVQTRGPAPLGARSLSRDSSFSLTPRNWNRQMAAFLNQCGQISALFHEVSGPTPISPLHLIDP